MTNNFSASLKINSDNTNSQSEQSGNKTETELNALSLWNKFLELLSDSLKTSEVNTWFSVVVPKSLENNVLTIVVPSEDYYSLIESRYNKIIAGIIETLLGSEGKLNYEITQMGLFSNTEKEKDIPVAGIKENITGISSDNSSYGDIRISETETEEEFNSNLNQKHIFDNFTTI